MIRPMLLVTTLALSLVGLSGCATPNLLSEKPSTTKTISNESINVYTFPNDPTFWQSNNPTMIWHRLQQIPQHQLQSGLNQTSTPAIAAWIKLALINKQSGNNTSQLVTELIQWRAENTSHPANSLFPDDSTLTSLQTIKSPHHLAVLLPLEGTLSASGQAVRDGFLSAYYQSAASTHAEQTLSFYDTHSNSSIPSLYQQALAEGADTVIGPLTKENVKSLLNQGSFSIPTLALNYTDLWFGSLPANFYEYGLSPDDEAQQVANKAAFAGLKKAIIIAPQNTWGQRVSNQLISRWKSSGGTVSDIYYFNSKNNLTAEIASLLHVNPNQTRSNRSVDNTQSSLEQQRRQDFDVIFLLAEPDKAREIVPLLKYYYADNVPIYATSTVYSGAPTPQKDSDLNGVIFCDIPWVLEMAGHHNNHTLKEGSYNRLFAVGHDAYLLSNQFARLEKLPLFPIQGATGALTLTQQQKIYRYLSWTTIHNGRP